MEKLESGPIPLYFQLERILRSRISAGEIRPGERLPSEMELCDEFGICRSTVRQAIKSLEIDGLIRRERGRGTVLIPPEEKNLALSLHGSMEDFYQWGAKYRLKLTSKKLVKPDKSVKVDMNLREGEKVYLFEGLRTDPRNQNALCYFQAHVPRAIGSKIQLKQELESPFLILEVEAVTGETIHKIRQFAKAVAADARLAAKLKVKRGSPLLCLKRVYINREGKALERALSHIPGEAYELATEMVWPGR